MEEEKEIINETINRDDCLLNIPMNSSCAIVRSKKKQKPFQHPKRRHSDSVVTLASSSHVIPNAPPSSSPVILNAPPSSSVATVEPASSNLYFFFFFFCKHKNNFFTKKNNR